jgi:hypothetical protein
LLPYTVNVKSGPPIAAAAGFNADIVGTPTAAIVCGLELSAFVPGFVTTSDIVPPCATNEAGRVALIEVEVCALTLSAMPLAVTLAVAEKSLPASVSGTAPDPASTDTGEADTSTGMGCVICKLSAALVPPAGAGLNTAS